MTSPFQTDDRQHGRATRGRASPGGRRDARSRPASRAKRPTPDGVDGSKSARARSAEAPGQSADGDTLAGRITRNHDIHAAHTDAAPELVAVLEHGASSPSAPAGWRAVISY